MSYRELIQSLRKDGEDAVNQLWSEVRAEAEKINTDASRKIDELREQNQKTEKSAIREQKEIILLEAEKSAHIIRLSSEKALSDRIFPIAQSLLHELRNERYDGVFASLVKELPSACWETVHINPLDVEIAQKHFPDSLMQPDDAITGGFEAVSSDEKIRVINTFKKRLERAWEDVLPLLIKEAYKEVASHEAS